jgi:segregation and condensation protein B
MGKKNKNKNEVLETNVEIENFDENELLKEFGAIQEDVEIFEPASDEDSTVLEADSSLTEGTELDGYESSEIVEQEFIADERVESIVESVLFSTDKAVTVGAIKQIFAGTNIKTDRIRKAIDRLSIDYASGRRGVTLEEINGGYQLRTKMDNVEYLRRLHKERPFKLSGPALEVLSICAYKQPLIKSEVDQIRGVESGHLMRALMDRRLIQFAGKSDLPGKPMLYGTTRLFLEIFGLRNIKELPSLSEIDELIPEGITPESAEKKETLGDLSSEMGLAQGHSYSESEEELSKITEKLQEIDTTTEFFEEEKRKEKARLEARRAQEIQEAIEFQEDVSTKDKNWLKR